jgi:hypothetical protein
LQCHVVSCLEPRPVNRNGSRRVPALLALAIDLYVYVKKEKKENKNMEVGAAPFL